MGHRVHTDERELMSSLWDSTYVVTDVETTGSHPIQHRIIEIGCVVIRGGEISDRIESLINPHQFIPPFIEQLTGISKADVFTAPEEQDVLPLVARLLSHPDAVFVAHQVLFDWRFLSQGFERCGITIGTVPRLCTLRLARRLLPHERKKNLDALAAYFGVSIERRHRALGDAEATAHILLCLLEEAERNGIESLDELLSFQYQRRPRRIPQYVIRAVEPLLDTIPASPGVYTMYNGKGQVLYVGKASVLSDRVRSYFQPSTELPRHIEQMVRHVRHIEWEETATELSALVREYERIRALQPTFNVVHRSMRPSPLLRLTDEEFPRIELTMHHDGSGDYFGPFTQRGTAEDLRTMIEELFSLRRCSGPLTPSAGARPCFYFHLKRCGAPCALLQSADDYAKQVERVRQILHGDVGWIIERLRAQMEEAAEQLHFERAERIRQRIRQLELLAVRLPIPSASLSQMTALIAVPTVYEAATVELFAFISGRLVLQRVIGRRSPLDDIAGFLKQHLSNDEKPELSADELAVLRIVTTWMYRHRGHYRIALLDGAESLEASLHSVLARQSDDATRIYVPIEEA